MSKILTLHDPASARKHYLAGVWQMETLYSLARQHATVSGNAYALRDSGRRLTWGELVAWSDSVAAELHGKGMRRGDRVAVWLSNRVEYVVILLACSRNGYVCVPSLHQSNTVAEVLNTLDAIQCRAMFAESAWGADAASKDVFEEARALKCLSFIYSLASSRIEGARSENSGMRMPDLGQRSHIPLPPHSDDPDQVVYLGFTSGTTGAPRGVMHSDNTLLANGRALVTDWSVTAADVLFLLSPMSHHIATVAIEQSLISGCELVIYDPFAGMSAFEWIALSQATYVMGVPTHAIDLLRELERRGESTLGTVTVFYMAGSVIPKDVARKLLSINVKPQNVYGMTENGSHQYTKSSDPSRVLSDTCGKSCTGYEIKLWQPHNRDLECAPGKVGEIGGRGGLLMLGYFNDQAATEASFNRSGWFMSGDLGRIDEEGNLEIVGRKTDLIIRGGRNIHPAHIEEVAMSHPSIRNAAAFGVKDRRLGEKVCLAIVSDGTLLTTDEVLLHLRIEGLSRFDMPEYLLMLPDMPMTASGKILKRALVHWVNRKSVTPKSVRSPA